MFGSSGESANLQVMSQLRVEAHSADVASSSQRLGPTGSAPAGFVVGPTTSATANFDVQARPPLPPTNVTKRSVSPVPNCSCALYLDQAYKIRVTCELRQNARRCTFSA